MKSIKIPRIGKNQYLKHIMSSIPNRVILFKKLTGIGATSLEIEDETRNSLIFEPNVPVILGKEGKYNKHQKKIIGVVEGISVDDIIEYLESSITPKKIITTPES